MKILFCCFLIILIEVSEAEMRTILKSDLLPTLASLAGNAEDDGGACDLMILPDDNGTFSSLQILDNIASLNKDNRGIILAADITTSLVEGSKCPLAVLETASVDRFDKVRKIAAGTRSPISVAVVTDTESLIDAYRTTSWRFTFIASLITTAGPNKLKVETIIPTENEAWKTVRVVYVPGAHYSNEMYIQFKPDGNHAGRDWEVLGQLAKKTGISYIFKPSPNSFVGMIDEVNAGRADMAISQGSFETKRYTRAGDISTPYDVRVFSLVANKPQEMPARCMLFLSSITMAMALKLLNAESVIYDDVKIDNFRIIVLSAMTLINESLPESWFHFRLQSKMGTVLMFTWLPCGLLLTLAYESTLLSQLVSVEYDDAIDTWQEVYDSGALLTVQSYLIMNSFMKNSKREIIQKVYKENVVAKGGLYGREDKARIEQMIAEGKAMKLGTTSFLSGEKHLRMWGEPLAHTFTGSHFVKKFPWRKQQDMIILRLVAADILNKLRYNVEFDWSKPERDYERNTPAEGEKKLTLTHMWLTWIILGVGTVLSILGFACERLGWWLGIRKEKKQQGREHGK